VRKGTPLQPCCMAVATSARAAPGPKTFRYRRTRQGRGLARAANDARRIRDGAHARPAGASSFADRQCGREWRRRPTRPQTSSIYLDGIEGEALVIALDLKGLAVSTGAACSSGAIEPSHVLSAMGLTPNRARSSIRLSLGEQNTMEEVEVAIALVAETVSRLRELSPVWPRRESEISILALGS